MSQINTIVKFSVNNVSCFEIFFKIVIKIPPRGEPQKGREIQSRVIDDINNTTN